MSDFEATEAPAETEAEEPTEAEPAETEPVEEPEAKPETKEDRSHRALRRKVEKFKRERESFLGDRARFEQEKATLAEERLLADRFRRVQTLSKTDRAALLDELDIDLDTLTSDILAEASVDPETKKLRGAVAEMKRERDEATARAKAIEAAKEREMQRTNIARSTIEAAKASDFPHVAKMPPDVLMRKVDSLFDEMRAKGITEAEASELTFEDLAEVVNVRQAAKLDRRRKELEAMGYTRAEAAKVVAASESAKAAPSSRTLKRGGDAGKAEPRELTREERRARAIALIPDSE